jgi:2-polyprenyl-3-methyl-5-hydroxy-6-metoxy-1,4-benzoquinol methylase
MDLMKNVYEKIKRKEFSSALKEFEVILKNHKKLEFEYALKGELYFNLKDFIKAEEIFNCGLVEKKMIAECFLGLGLIKKQEDKFLEAKEYFIKSLNEKELVNAWLNLGELYANGFGIEKNEIEALNCFEKAYKIDPHSSLYASYKGNLFYNKGEYHKAIKSYLIPFVKNDNHFDLNPEHEKYIYFMKKILINIDMIARQGQPLNQLLIAILEQALMLKNNQKYKHINKQFPKKVYGTAVALGMRQKVDEILSLGFISKKLTPEITNIKIREDKKIFNLDESNPKDILSDEIFLEYLNSVIIINGLESFICGNIVTELFFTAIRKLLLTYITIDNQELDEITNIDSILAAISYQCFNNEYIWIVTQEEKVKLSNLSQIIIEKIKDNKTPHNKEILILSSYMKLKDYSEIYDYFKDNTCDQNLSKLIKMHIEDFELEKKYQANIQSLNKIKNKISLDVRSQYEKFPYPRWDDDSIESYKMVNYVGRINKDIFPNSIKDSEIKKVLIAGCGTGHQAIVSAITDPSVLVHALDLSKSSLSYGKRKADEYGIKNIVWSHGDIMNLNSSEHKYDLIESCGVLHHMEDPKKAFSILTSKLNSKGYFKLALYAKKYRETLAFEKSLIKKLNLRPNLEGVRRAREVLFKEGQNKMFSSSSIRDFYSTSECIDLLMHTQELSYDIDELETFFQSKYSFLGFVFGNSLKQKLYDQNFPEDYKRLNLKNWKKLENDNPNLFSSMYQLWMQKF